MKKLKLFFVFQTWQALRLHRCLLLKLVIQGLLFCRHLDGEKPTSKQTRVAEILNQFVGGVGNGVKFFFSILVLAEISELQKVSSR